MTEPQHLRVTEVGNISVIEFNDHRILDPGPIEEMGKELYALVEQDRRKYILLDFRHVAFLSSAALGKLLSLNRRAKAAGARIKLSNIRPEIYEVFEITQLNQLFAIYNDSAEALAAFANEST